jgi:23S rRNA U2552 (ribose-2'-O)-methylase RlmE/FtsJ
MKQVITLSTRQEPDVFLSQTELDTIFSGLSSFNHELEATTMEVKDRISKYSNNRYNEWDHMKKMTNPFEMIFSNTHDSISKKRPISRSYFKLREIVLDYWDRVTASSKDDSPLTTAHIAEAPGGFIECMIDFEREGLMHLRDLHGLSYIVKDRKIPSWRVPRDYIGDKVHLNKMSGDNLDGNIYEMSDVREFIGRVGTGTCDFVTADGGFDCSGDFNVQESKFALMLSSEIYIALSVQKAGGAFVVKVFDMFEEATARILSCLKRFYATMSIIKPSTSRPANSEKYILVSGYDPAAGTLDDLTKLEQAIVSGTTGPFISAIALDKDVYVAITDFNMKFTYNQNINIMKTISCIEIHRTSSITSDIFERMRDEQIKYGTSWCATYSVPHKTGLSAPCPSSIT